MKYWDSSALVPLFIQESMTEKMLEILRKDPVIITWWGSPVECISALAREEKRENLTVKKTQEAIQLLETLQRSWYEVEPSDKVRFNAIRLLRMHTLRAADSFQLASALVACDQNPSLLPFVSLDERLNDAARREGFTVVEVEVS